MYIVEVNPEEGAASIELYELGNAANKAWGAYVNAPSEEKLAAYNAACDAFEAAEAKFDQQFSTVKG